MFKHMHYFSMFISVVDLITAHILQSFRQKVLISINLRRLDKLRT